jgi:hypothetical protein
MHAWRRYTSYRAADDWVFASPAARGQKPYWGQCLMRTIIRPAAKIGITQHIGWHAKTQMNIGGYAGEKRSPYPRRAEYDVALPESSIRIKMADGHPDFFI